MVLINENYLKISESYLFAETAKKIREYLEKNPNKKLISLGIGDVTKPLTEPVILGLYEGVKDMASKTKFKGYGPYAGYDFLRNALVNYYKEINVDLDKREIFISDGAKSDLGNILDIFSKDNKVLVSDPVYPVYVDTNIMDGRSINYINCTSDNNFLEIPSENTIGDIIYICSPNNPTGTCYNKDQLKLWVDYARKNKSIIIFDAAYEAFIREDNIPRSIYEIEGAKECAIEICSFSKTAGFTGMRCGYTVIPHNLKVNNIEINKLWYRRISTKFNGVSYLIQKAAVHVFTEEGRKKTREIIDYYLENGKILRKTFDKLNMKYYGGVNSPYIWLKCPYNMTSWEFFDLLLERCQIAGTPGIGFGKNGEGYFRISCFGDRDNIIEASLRLSKVFGNLGV